MRSAVARIRRALAARLRRRENPTRGGGIEDRYQAWRRRPIDPSLAVFGAYWYRGYACNPRGIYERARELVPDLRPVWVVRRASASSMPKGVEFVLAQSDEYYDLIARAGVFVNNVNFPDHYVKREGQAHVMTHHGTPLKRMGLDLRDSPSAMQRGVDFDGLAKRCARWDYSVAANPFSTEVWRRAYPGDWESLETGYPRNDVLAAASEDDVARVRSELGLAPGQRVVLYAPTRREYDPSGGPSLDLGKLAAGLGPDHVVLARSHYLVGAAFEAGGVRDVTEHPSVEELCLAADVLVTDYSSIMFDYAVLDRPIVIHAPDWDEYRTKRGTYFDLLAEPPGTVATDDDGVLDALRSGAAFGDQARLARAAFRTRFCSLEDGHAGDRVVRRVWLGERDATTASSTTVAP